MSEPAGRPAFSGEDASSPRGRDGLLALHRVGLSYELPDGGELAVLAGIELAAGAGRMTCVAGRSGSGKTSLLHVAAGFLAPTAGEVAWQGRTIDAHDRGATDAQRGGFIGFVFQDGALISALNAAENVAIVRGTRGRQAGRKEVGRLLAAVGLGGRARHFPAQLSGGERQRVALARALNGDPPLIVADEPTANLDRTTADAVIALLLAQREAGRALLVASHDPGLIAVADELIRLD